MLRLTAMTVQRVVSMRHTSTPTCLADDFSWRTSLVTDEAHAQSQSPDDVSRLETMTNMILPSKHPRPGWPKDARLMSVQ